MPPALPLEQFMLPERRKRLVEIARARTRNLCVVLDAVHDPHNLSAVLRSCEAFGLLDLYVIESQKRFRCKRKVSLGAEKWLDVHRYPKPLGCIQALTSRGYELWVADPGSTGVEVDALPWERRLALAFGNEHEGASAEFVGAATGRFFIPMYGFGESFNISVAAGICLAIGVRERQRRLGRHGDLPEEEQASLIARWQRRSVRHADRILKALAANGPANEGEKHGSQS